MRLILNRLNSGGLASDLGLTSKKTHFVDTNVYPNPHVN